MQFSGVNVQVVSGAGETNAAVNGEGNLVIGYDENPGKHEQSGSDKAGSLPKRFETRIGKPKRPHGAV